MHKFIAGEALQPGDLVSIDRKGRMVKTRPKLHFLGALPPGTTVKDGVVRVPLASLYLATPPAHTQRFTRKP
jgi:hypothetical protein